MSTYVRCQHCGRWADKPQTKEEEEAEHKRFGEFLNMIAQKKFERQEKHRLWWRQFWRKIFLIEFIQSKIVK